MGAIINKDEHLRDVAEIRALVGMCPVLSRYLSHHLRNALAGAMGACQNNRPEDVLTALEHLAADLKEVGL